MKERWSPGAGVVKQRPPLHHESARLSVSRPESGGPRDRNAGLRRLRNPASRIGGAEGARTPDPKTASLVLSQLSYSPTAGTQPTVRDWSCQDWLLLRGRASRWRRVLGPRASRGTREPATRGAERRWR